MIRFIRSFALTSLVMVVAAAANAQGRPPVPPPVPPAPPAPPAPITSMPPMPPMAPLAPLPRVRINDLDIDALTNLRDRVLTSVDIDAMNAVRDAAQSQRDAMRDAMDAQRDALMASRDGMLGAGNLLGRLHLDGGPRYQNDPADSLYRAALALLNNQDYRAAAQRFKEVQQKYPSSQYLSRAMYYQALMLFRAGSDAELKEAITVLEAQQKQFPGTSAAGGDKTDKGDKTDRSNNSNNSRGVSVGNGNGNGRGVTFGNVYNYNYAYSNSNYPPDVPGLLIQIRSAQAKRGDPAARQLLNQAAAGGTQQCDRDDQQVQAEALSGLMRIDPAAATTHLEKILAKRDECSTALRQRALQILRSNGDDKSIATLIATAKSDPSTQMRLDAVEYIAHFNNDDVFNALESLARTEQNDRIRRAAAAGLVGYSSAKARPVLRALIEDNTQTDGLRVEIINRYNNGRGTVEDGAMLRTAYPKVTSRSVKQAIVSAVGHIGGPDNQKWLMDMSTNDQESAGTRAEAFRSVAAAMSVQDLGHAFDNAGSGPMRQSIVEMLDRRKEPEALDKLIEIVKKGNDPEVRRYVISLLSRRKDPKITALFAELIDR